VPFVTLLEEAKAAAMTATAADPWALPIARLKGQVGADGVERISTQAVLDILEVAQKDRKRSTFTRLSKLMREAGWVPIRARDLTRGGGAKKDQARGYARDVCKRVML
jgi:hypothetical protein